jgi:nucleoside triphosphate diphosphatase
MTAQAPIDRLKSIMAALRTPETGCPWDLAQSFETIAPYTIEEAYEVSDAIARKDMMALKEELGDLLFQVIFHARLGEEQNAFDFDDVVTGLNTKMIARHPHVFGDARITNAEDQIQNWETLKDAERKAKIKDDPSVLADIPLALPELMRAEKLAKRAARVGFDWPHVDDVFAKLDEEVLEVRDALKDGEPNHIEEEIGDLLFVVANLARKAHVDPELALRKANSKFENRFRWIETALRADGKTPEQSDLEEMERLWGLAKRAERGQ